MLSTCRFAGNGKTHYILERLKGIPQPQQLIIAVNEAFTYMAAIEKLCSLPSDKMGCAIFFNFTILPLVVSLDEACKSIHVQYLHHLTVYGT